MTDKELQKAIDKTRLWLDTTKSASVKAKEDAIYALSELQKIQCTRAGMVYQMPNDEDYMAAMGPCGK